MKEGSAISIRHHLTVTGALRRIPVLVLRSALVLAFVVFMLAPTVFIFPLALNNADVLGFPPRGYSLRHVAAVAQSPGWREAFASSFQVGALASVIATVLGLACALARPLVRTAFARPFEMLIMSPFVIPPVVLAVGWFAVFAKVDLLGSVICVAVGHALLGLPIVYLNVSAGMTLLDPQLVLASRSLGATPIFTLLRIQLPLLAPSLLSGALLTFVLSLDELIVALFLGGGLVKTVPIAMWTQINYVATPELAAAAALSVSISLGLLALTLVVLLEWQRRVSSRHIERSKSSVE